VRETFKKYQENRRGVTYMVIFQDAIFAYAAVMSPLWLGQVASFAGRREPSEG